MRKFTERVARTKKFALEPTFFVSGIINRFAEDARVHEATLEGQYTQSTSLL